MVAALRFHCQYITSAVVLLGTVFEGITRPTRRRELLALNSRRGTQCRQCRLARYCTGGCPVNNFSKTGSLVTPDPQQCGDAAARFRVAEAVRNDDLGLRRLLSITAEARGRGRPVILYFSRGRGFGHAMIDMAINEHLPALCPDLQVEFVSYATGVEAFRSHGHPVVDLQLPMDPGRSESLRNAESLIAQVKPDLVVAHEESAAIAAAADLGVASVFITHWFTAPTDRLMVDLAGADEIVFIDNAGVFVEPPFLAGKVTYVGPAVRQLAPPRKGREELRRELGLDPKTIVVLCVPGIQSDEESQRLYDLVSTASDMLRLPDSLLVWVARENQAALQRLAQGRCDRLILGHDWRLGRWVTAADAIVTRSNYTTVRELDALGIRSVSLTSPAHPIDSVYAELIPTTMAVPSDASPAQVCDALRRLLTEGRQEPRPPFPTGARRAAERIAARLEATVRQSQERPSDYWRERERRKQVHGDPCGMGRARPLVRRITREVPPGGSVLIVGGAPDPLGDLVSDLQCVTVCPAPRCPACSGPVVPTNVAGAAEALPFRAGLFDVVATIEAGGHAVPSQLAIREMLRVAKPSGVTFIAKPEEGDAASERAEDDLVEAWGQHARVWSQDGLWCLRPRNGVAGRASEPGPPHRQASALPVHIRRPERPKVSAIILTFNRADFLAECLESVRTQTYPNLEVIVVDDGSTDTTAAITRQYRGPLLYLRQPNQGSASAANLGLDHATGDYVWLMDDDDLALPHLADSLVAELERQPELAVAYGSTEYWRDGLTDEIISRKTAREYPRGWQLFGALRDLWFWSKPAALIRRTHLDEAGRLDEQLVRCEDWDLWVRLMAQRPVGGLPVPVLRCRMHERVRGPARHQYSLSQAGTLTDEAMRIIMARVHRDVPLERLHPPPRGERARGWRRQALIARACLMARHSLPAQALADLHQVRGIGLDDARRLAPIGWGYLGDIARFANEYRWQEQVGHVVEEAIEQIVETASVLTETRPAEESRRHQTGEQVCVLVKACEISADTDAVVESVLTSTAVPLLLVVLSDRAAPEDARSASAMGVEWLSVPGASDEELLRRGATRARAPYVWVLTGRATPVAGKLETELRLFEREPDTEIIVSDALLVDRQGSCPAVHCRADHAIRSASAGHRTTELWAVGQSFLVRRSSLLRSLARGGSARPRCVDEVLRHLLARGSTRAVPMPTIHVRGEIWELMQLEQNPLRPFRELGFSAAPCPPMESPPYA